MLPLLSHEKRALLKIARKSVESAVAGFEQRITIELTGNLALPAGAFVSLHHLGRLRGCIGRLVGNQPLAEIVKECAAAATSDPRFRKLTLHELAHVEIEISVLSEPRICTAGEVEPGIHGIIISGTRHRGVLLPQVAVKYRWSRQEFLEQACMKAGLASNAWKHPETQIAVFTAEVFAQKDFCRSELQDAAEANASPYSSSQ